MSTRWSFVLLLLYSLTLNAAEPQVTLDVAVGTPVLLAGTGQTAYLKVALTGFATPQTRQRTPVNVALVLDKSGSMSGEKIYHAREAALLAVERLNADDIVSIVAYDDQVEVLVPATRLSDRQAVRRAIEQLEAGGNTALFAGVAKGAAEVQKFLDRERFNRIILLSDGLANVGPASPAELGRLGASLARDGISVTTLGLGLGYNEDLMTQLAGMSDGNHAFIENAADLARIFDAELGDVLSVVAQDVDIQIHCAPGVRPLRVLGREAEIRDGTVRLNLNQLYGQQEKFVLIEVAIDAGANDESRELATVAVAYDNMLTRARDQLAGAVSVSFSASAERVTENVNAPVMSSAVEQLANESSKEAVQLRDQGRVEEAKRKLESSADYVRENAAVLGSSSLESLSQELKQDADALDDEQDWNRTRKDLRQKQYSRDVQQRY